MSLDWVRCNSCFFRPSPRVQCTLYLTSCGHFVCSNCCEKAISRAQGATITPNTLPACLVCHKPCSLAQLGKEAQLNKDIMFYFTDPVVALKKLSQAAEFQKMNYEKLTEWQSKKRLMDEITELKRKRESFSIVQSHFESNHNRLLQVLHSIRQKAASAGVHPKTTPVSLKPCVSTDTQSPHLTTPHSQGQRSYLPNKVQRSTPTPDQTTYQLPSNRRMHEIMSSVKNTTPRGSLSSAIVTPEKAVMPFAIPTTSSSARNSACTGITPHLAGLQSTEKPRDVRVSMNQAQMPRKRKASTPQLTPNATRGPSMSQIPQSVPILRQMQSGMAQNRHFLTPNSAIGHPASGPLKPRTIPNVGQLRTPLNTLRGGPQNVQGHTPQMMGSNVGVWQHGSLPGAYRI